MLRWLFSVLIAAVSFLLFWRVAHGAQRPRGLPEIIGRAIERPRLPPLVKPGDEPRNPTTRDPARERDATSLGVCGIHPSSTGLALAGGGVAAHAAQKLATIGKHVTIKIGPAIMLGGGGVLLSGKW